MSEACFEMRLPGASILLTAGTHLPTAGLTGAGRSSPPRNCAGLSL